MPDVTPNVQVHVGAESALVDRLLQQVDALKGELREQQKALAASAAQPESDKSSFTALLIAGCALGVAVGALTGLAQSPTVGAVAAAAVGLGGTWIGLHGQRGRFHGILGFLTGFGLMVALATPLALLARTHALFSPSPGYVLKKYLDAGFDSDLAQRVALLELGYQFPAPKAEPSKPEQESADTRAKASTAPATQPIAKVPTPSDGNLMAAPTRSECDELTNKLLRAEVPLSNILQLLEERAEPWSPEIGSTRASLQQTVDARCQGAK